MFWLLLTSLNPKAKKNSHSKARDYENSVELYEDAKSGKKKTISDKELLKVLSCFLFCLFFLFIFLTSFCQKEYSSSCLTHNT